MNQRCYYFDQGYCRSGNRCRFYHDDKSKSKKYTNDSDKSFQKSTYKKPPYSDYNCEEFLKGKCDNQKCSGIHNFSIKFKEENNKEFAIKYNTFSQDFSILEPYEKKVFGNSTLDIMFLVDCTGWMGSWIKAAKEELLNIIQYIVESNPYSKVKGSFVGYRDFCDAKSTQGQFQMHDFTDDFSALEKFIAKVQAFGGCA
jgi:hypothetical protein